MTTCYVCATRSDCARACRDSTVCCARGSRSGCDIAASCGDSLRWMDCTQARVICAAAACRHTCRRDDVTTTPLSRCRRRSRACRSVSTGWSRRASRCAPCCRRDSRCVRRARSLPRSPPPRSRADTCMQQRHDAIDCTYGKVTHST